MRIMRVMRANEMRYLQILKGLRAYMIETADLSATVEPTNV
jgi:hypothetical protein